MKKTFMLWVACALPMIAALNAHEGGEEIAKIQVDRERLIDLVLNLEADFGKILEDYTKVQKEHAALLNRPVVVDQSGKVKELQMKLAAATAQVKEQEMAKSDTHAQALLAQDLVNLRNELHRERQDLLLAKAQLLRVKQLEKKGEDLEASLSKESKNSAIQMAKLQVIRGECDALLGEIEGLVARAEKAEKGQREATVRISELEKDTNTLKLTLEGKDVEIRKLRVEQSHRKGALVVAEDLRKERDRLTQLLTTREKELDDLLTDLAAEMKRSLDIPVLIKARDDLEQKLTASTVSVNGLEKKNKALTRKQAELQEEIETVQRSISAMEAELAENKDAMVKVAALGEANKSLVAEREQLIQTIAMAEEESVKFRGVLQTTEAELVESRKKSARAEEFEKENSDLLAQLEAHKTQVATAKVDMEVLQRKVSENEAAKKAAAQLGEKVVVLSAERDLLNSKLEETKAAHLGVEAKLKTAQVSLLKQGERSDQVKKAKAESETLRKSLEISEVALKKAEDEAEDEAAKVMRLKKSYEALTASAARLDRQRMTLSDEVKKRDDDLKKLRAEMASKPDLSADLLKLKNEKDKLSVALAAREADLKTMRDDLGRLQLSASVAKKQVAVIKRESAKIDAVRYAKGEADVTTQQALVLTQVQKVLKLFPKARFEIVGHTCDIGSAEGNLLLSQQRSQALQDFLIEKGIDKNRLNSRGVGLSEPMVPNTSEENRRQNRRVVVKILD